MYNMKFGLFSRTLPGGDAPQFSTLEDEFRARGVELLIFGRDFSSWSDFPEDVSLLLSLGGDGTFLRALCLVRDRDIPVAGINAGRLGFLTAAGIGDDDFNWIDDLVQGRYQSERRSLIRCSCLNYYFPEEFYPFAANEISIQREGAGMISVDVALNGRCLPTYWADGLVISTPTGSTAYNLSIGGPIVIPGSDVLVITPIAPHNLNVRPLVVPMDDSIELSFTTRDKGVLLMCDNRSVSVPCGTKIAVEKGPYGFRYLSLQGDNFIKALRTKLLWGQDKRNTTL